MTLTQVEQILVVPTELFHSLGYFQGFSRSAEGYLDRLLDPLNVRYLPRHEMERDANYKQLIPYCIFRYLDQRGDAHLFQYTRGSGQGESRLHALRSIGVGGHISLIDAGERNPYLEGLRRELEEEVEIDTDFDERLVGLINDDENDVGRVHLGVVHLFDVAQPTVKPREADLREAGFEPLDRILEEIAEFETWSQICLRALF
ncbi:MAG TPA: phosphoesterase [Pirellulaceae bacterium]|nr:phosphoesterase [Pirellulaceae bacterium]